jgi:hypothetical protein
MLLGRIAVGQGQCNEALTHFNMALTLCEQRGLQREISMVCCNLGDVYMMKAEYGLAQSFFLRSLSIAEQIGDNQSTCITFGNLGILSMRAGNLSDSERWYLKAIKLAQRISDPVYISLICSVLASVLHSEGKIAEARKNLYVALQISRSARIAPCVGLSLVVLGNTQVLNVLCENSEKTKSGFDRNQVQMLERAKRTVLRALRLNDIEAETNMEGQLTLAYIELLLGSVDTALTLSLKIMEEAGQAELVWLVARSKRVLGEIFAAKGLDEKADKYFGEALSQYDKSEMRLEYARTLYYYGKTLLARDDVEKDGLEFLQEAQQILDECGALLDLQMVKNTLLSYQEVDSSCIQ